jgi:hypothetical protein
MTVRTPPFSPPRRFSGCVGLGPLLGGEAWGWEDIVREDWYALEDGSSRIGFDKLTSRGLQEGVGHG